MPTLLLAMTWVQVFWWTVIGVSFLLILGWLVRNGRGGGSAGYGGDVGGGADFGGFD